MLFSHYADWAGPQSRLWFAEQGKKLKEHSHTLHKKKKEKKERERYDSHEPRKIMQRAKKRTKDKLPSHYSPSDRKNSDVPTTISEDSLVTRLD